MRAKDKEITKLVEKATRLKTSIVSTTLAVKRSISYTETERERKRLKKYTEDLQDTNVCLNRLVPQGSGSVSIAGLQEPNIFLQNLTEMVRKIYGDLFGYSYVNRILKHFPVLREHTKCLQSRARHINSLTLL